MSEQADNKKVAPVTEWVIGSEEDLRKALPAMMRYRNLILQALGAKMGGRQLFSAFLRGKQAHLRADSFFDACAAMELEVVVRPPQTKKSRQRIEGQRAQALAHRAELARQIADTLAEQAADAAKVVEEISAE